MALLYAAIPASAFPHPSSLVVAVVQADSLAVFQPRASATAPLVAPAAPVCLLAGSPLLELGSVNVFPAAVGTVDAGPHFVPEYLAKETEAQEASPSSEVALALSAPASVSSSAFLAVLVSALEPCFLVARARYVLASAAHPTDAGVLAVAAPPAAAGHAVPMAALAGGAVAAPHAAALPFAEWFVFAGILASVLPEAAAATSPPQLAGLEASAARDAGHVAAGEPSALLLGAE